MSVNGWRLYNHAAIPSTPPHENPDIRPIEDGSIWRAGGGTPLLARWTTEFDCGYETTWWYVIKDIPFDITALKAKRRYVINKGTLLFEVKRIDSNQYAEEMYRIAFQVWSTYPEAYRPNIDHDRYVRSVSGLSGRKPVFGAFLRETGQLCGYAYLEHSGKCANLVEVKALPECEKLQINAAIVFGILDDYAEFLQDGYICDGARNISHETAYQDYLEKYFGFRKAFCHLHIEYNPKIKWIINLIYPFRQFLLKFDDNRLIHQVNSILKMEELVRGKNE